MVLTRLHARYGKDDAKDDLVFEKANPIVGGREYVVNEKTGKLEEGATEDSYNNFQGRYIIRHLWTGAIKCKNPQRGIWGGPPGDPYGDNPTPIAMDGHAAAFVKRGKVKLTRELKQSVPEIGIKISKKKKKKKKKAPPAEVKPTTPATGSGSGSSGMLNLPPQDVGAGLGLGLAGFTVIGFALRRRRRA